MEEGAGAEEGGVSMCPAEDTGGCWGSGSDVGVDDGGIAVDGGGSGGGWHVPLSSYNFWCSISVFFQRRYPSLTQQCSWNYSEWCHCHLFRLLFFPLFILTLKNVLTD